MIKGYRAQEKKTKQWTAWIWSEKKHRWHFLISRHFLIFSIFPNLIALPKAAADKLTRRVCGRDGVASQSLNERQEKDEPTSLTSGMYIYVYIYTNSLLSLSPQGKRENEGSARTNYAKSQPRLAWADLCPSGTCATKCFNAKVSPEAFFFLSLQYMYVMKKKCCFFFF